MPTKIIVTIGQPGSPAIPPVGNSYTLKYQMRTTVGISRTVKFNIPNPSVPSSRFLGDPGNGNILIGLAAGSGNNTDFSGAVATLGKAISIHRYYNGSGVINWAKAQYAASVNCIPSASIIYYNQLALGSFGGSGGMTGPAQAYLDAIVTQLATLRLPNGKLCPMGFMWVHEPENPSKKTGAALDQTNSLTKDNIGWQNYRADKRAITAYMRARSPNYVHCDIAYMDPFTWNSGSQHRNWWVWHTDWKGTVQPGATLTNPNPLDFYQGAQSMVDMTHVDIYDSTGDSATKSWDDDFLQAYNPIHKAMPNMPFGCSEWGVISTVPANLQGHFDAAYASWIGHNLLWMGGYWDINSDSFGVEPAIVAPVRSLFNHSTTKLLTDVL